MVPSDSNSHKNSAEITPGVDQPYPFGMGGIVLDYPELAGQEVPILLGTRIVVPSGDYHLFASSNLVKDQLECRIQSATSSYETFRTVHPNLLELRAAIATITFLERVALRHQHRWGTVKILENDNWNTINWIFIGLFEDNQGFIARWQDQFCYQPELWKDEIHYKASDLSVKSLEGDSGKAYYSKSGQLLLEYVNRI